MNLSDFSIKSPYAIIAGSLLIIALGMFAFFRTATDLFPDTVPPQVAVITVWSGADSKDIADKITQIIEKELNTLSGLKRITSTSRDGVSSINAEFFYDKPLGEATLDVQNAVNRIKASLPADIMEPRIYRISDATKPLLTIALTPKKNSLKTLSDIRLLAENQIEDAFLNINGVADVDIFGSQKPEIKVLINRAKLVGNNLTLNNVLAALQRNNISSPAGTIYSPNKEYLVKISNEFKDIAEIKSTPIVHNDNGIIRIQDVADVVLSTKESRSIYHGNGKPAIAMNLLKVEHGDSVTVIKNIKKRLPLLKAEYLDIKFEITDDQQPVIDLNVSGMRSSLLQAIFLTIVVIFMFLADIRTALIVSVSIPLAFLSSLVVLWFSPYTLNMVTLSGLIISVGMVVDGSIVVLENIFRHYQDDKDKDARRSASVGSREVALATTAGMLTTIIVLVPVMFAGGYTQQTMRPLNLMISSTLVASLVAALTIVPLMASRLLSHGKHKRNFVERLFTITDVAVERLGYVYLYILTIALKVRWFVILISIAFFVLTMKNVKPLLGGELMPKMDTGIVNIDFETPSDYTPKQVEKVLSSIEEQLYKTPGVISMSSTVGSEPGEMSFGGGAKTSQIGRIKVIMVDRLHRERDIWQIQDDWRKTLQDFPGIHTLQMSEYGATPLSTTRAPLDIIISGPDTKVLDKLANITLQALENTPGLVDVRKSWNRDKLGCDITIDRNLATFYGVSQMDIAKELRVLVKGMPIIYMRLNDYLDIPISVQYDYNDINSPEKLKNVYISTKYGQVPLRSMAIITLHREQPFITHEKLLPTIDITGINRGYTIGQVTAMVNKRVSKIKMPYGYSLDVAGSAANMKTGQAEMGRALIIGVVLLFILLIAMFKSFLHPFTIMSAIPLAISGGFWGLLIFDKPMCKPAMMGLILLSGTIVNNSILLLDFIIGARENGMSKNEAILHSVRLRLRPILMTTVSTIVGLTPLIFEFAVGLERMSPLGIVAACGLLVGTVLTLIVIPIVYSLMDSLVENTKQLFGFY